LNRQRWHVAPVGLTPPAAPKTSSQGDGHSAG